MEFSPGWSEIAAEDLAVRTPHAGWGQVAEGEADSVDDELDEDGTLEAALASMVDEAADFQAAEQANEVPEMKPATAIPVVVQPKSNARVGPAEASRMILKLLRNLAEPAQPDLGVGPAVVAMDAGPLALEDCIPPASHGDADLRPEVDAETHGVVAEVPLADDAPAAVPGDGTHWMQSAAHSVSKIQKLGKAILLAGEMDPQKSGVNGSNIYDPDAATPIDRNFSARPFHLRSSVGEASDLGVPRKKAQRTKNMLVSACWLLERHDTRNLLREIVSQVQHAKGTCWSFSEYLRCDETQMTTRICDESTAVKAKAGQQPPPGMQLAATDSAPPCEPKKRADSFPAKLLQIERKFSTLVEIRGRFLVFLTGNHTIAEHGWQGRRKLCHTFAKNAVPIDSEITDTFKRYQRYCAADGDAAIAKGERFISQWPPQRHSVHIKCSVHEASNNKKRVMTQKPECSDGLLKLCLSLKAGPCIRQLRKELRK